MDLLREKLRAQGHHKAQVAAAMIGSAVVGGAISAAGSKSAANTQANAANNATQAQRGMFDKTVQLEQPYNDAGVGATQKLSYLLGISPQQGGGAAPAPESQPAQPGQTSYSMPSSFPQQWTGYGGADVSWQSAAGLSSASDPNWHPPTYYNPNYNPNDASTYKGIPVGAFTKPQDAGVAQAQTGFAPQARSTMAAPVGGDPSGGAGGPGFGSLLKPFDMSDFQMDPGTQFRIKYGNQALQNSQAAQNGVMSGSALKDLIGFNQDYAGLGYQSAFDRYMANKSFTLGSLNDLANRGQAAAGNTVNGASQFSSGIASTITGAGNAQAAGTVGMSNALSGAATGSGNAYLLSNMLNGGNTGNNAQAAFSQTSAGSSGFGTGLAYGNQDYGSYL